MLVSKLDRFVRDRFHPTMSRTRNRMHTVAAGAALAAIAGLSAPAAAQAMAPTSHDAPNTVPAKAVAAITAHPTKSGPVTGKNKAKTAPTAKKVVAPTMKQLHPRGIPGGQQTPAPSAEQIRNARAIITAGQKMGLAPRAYVIAVATSLQETHLHNYGNLGTSNDHDSQGLFQQRPSSGWGTPAQVTDPAYASKSFYSRLVSVHGWSTMPLTDAAQSVQVSAFGDRYAQWEKLAGDLVLGHFGAGPYAKNFH